jgi:cytochrome c
MKFKSVAIVAIGMLVGGSVYAQSGADLAKSKNCMNCHDMEKKKVGPAFKDVAAKYKDNKDAEAAIIAKLKEGKGHPVKVAGSDAELKTLTQFALTGK